MLVIAESPDSLAQMDRKAQTYAGPDQTHHLAREPQSPLVAMFEDLHWIDSQTQALLAAFADSIANARVLLLVNYRPEYRQECG